MDISEVAENVFFGEDVYYDLAERNFLALGNAPADDGAEIAPDAPEHAASAGAPEARVSEEVIA
jgi:hypothetical protein